MDLKHDPTFIAWAWTTVVLSFNLLFLWGFSAAPRNKSKTVLNPEDTTTVAKGSTVVSSDPAEVARVMRAFNNAAANIVPTLILGLCFALLGGAPNEAKIIFGTFVAARWIHSIVYLNGVQPWRTLAFGVGALASLALVVENVRLLVS